MEWNRNMRLQRKLILTCSILIASVGIMIGMGSFFVYSEIYGKRTRQYIVNLMRQITNNYEHNIALIEDITFDILKNSVIQEELRRCETGNLTSYERNVQAKRIKNVLANYALFNDDIISLSVFAKDGTEFSIKKNIFEETLQLFRWEEIVAANGSTLWKVSEDGEDSICIARAILDLVTMKPIGYINVVCENEFFGSLIQDIVDIYSSRVYVINEENKVMCSNDGSNIGKQLLNEVLYTSKNYITFENITFYAYKDKKMSNNWTLIYLVPLNELRKEVVPFMIFSILFSIGCILCGVLASYYYTRRIISPLEELNKSMEAVEKGDFTKRLPVRSNDEIGQLVKRYNQMAEKIMNLIKRVYKMEISQKQAEIELLRMQINPHFLYNTLDTISWMARSEGNENIAEITTALGDLLRSTIKQDGYITVAQELDSVRKYLLIQKFLFGEKITIEYEIDERVLNYVIPNFLLQPLVENAIYHGIEPKMGAGLLKIASYIKDEKLYFVVSDNGIGMSKKQVEDIYNECKKLQSKNCIGIKNVYRRLYNYYGEESTLEIQSLVDVGTTVSISIPLRLLDKKN